MSTCSSYNFLKSGLILLGAVVLSGRGEPGFSLENYFLDELPGSDAASPTISQSPSVSDLSDVAPTDWAFEAVRSLVESYGCLSGYPDNRFRGNRSLSRYEFAAALNACLETINALIGSSLDQALSDEELNVVQRLQTEFADELTLLQGRVDALESEVATLEAAQFSTVSKLSGEAILSVSTATGGVSDQDTNLTLNNRLRLNFNTSFSGDDLLVVGLQSFNFGGGAAQVTSSLPGALGIGDPVFGTASNVSLGIAPQFGRSDPSDLSNQGINDVSLYKLLYVFPATDQLTMFVGSNVEATDALGAISPFANEGQGALSRFATTDNAVMRLSGGTSGIGLAAAAGGIWTISDRVDLTAFYGNVNANIPFNNGLLGDPATPLGAGLFDGSYVISSQLTAALSETLTLRVNYANSRHQINILGTGLSASDIGSVQFAPNTAQLAAAGGNATLAVLNEPIRLNSVGATLNWTVTPKVDLTLSGSYLFADLEDVDASTNFASWLLGVHFQDVFREGNTAALIFGQPLNRTSAGGIGFNAEDADPYHLEAYFNMPVAAGISITPGVFAVFNPEGQSGNDTTVTGVLRTTFTF